jgi:hypothetical protein
MDLAALMIPGSVLEGAHLVASRARDVVIRTDGLEAIASKIEVRLAAGTDDLEVAFGSAGALELDVNLVLFETACNFCFWTGNAEREWTVDVAGQVIGGWYALAACFGRAIHVGMPVYDATWMAELSIGRARELFAGTGAPIPLLEQRVNNIVEVANYLLRKHDGQALNMLRSASFSAPVVATTVARELASFRDGAWYRGTWVWFLKRAQILPSDLAQLSTKYATFQMTDRDRLTVFADYRLPQVLRHFDVLTYSPGLAAVVDAGAILPSGTAQEAEIRACTIEACEGLKRYLPERSSADIDLGLWLIGQDMRSDPALSPHHRTPGQFY